MAWERDSLPGSLGMGFIPGLPSLYSVRVWRLGMSPTAPSRLQDLDALVIPGGFAPDYWRRDKRFVDLVKNCYELGELWHSGLIPRLTSPQDS